MALKEQLRHRATSTSVSNGYSHRRFSMSTIDGHDRREELDKLDEEHGYDDYEKTSTLTHFSDKKKHCAQGKVLTKSSSCIHHGNSDEEESASLLDNCDADDTKNSTQSDMRSRKLLMQTAFWIACWYGTSLATLFLNKIILSRPGSSAHVLGIIQMTTAVVLGGWTSYGGKEWVQTIFIHAWQSLPASIRQGLLEKAGNGNTKGAEGKTCFGTQEKEPRMTRIQKENQSSVVVSPQKCTESALNSDGLKQSQPPKATINYYFVRDMAIVGLLRGLTVVLGLIALEHVPVSFVETIKATAPVFTVIFARLILQEHTATPVMFTLIPVVAGLILCSTSELRFDSIGFFAAVLNNCADCVQNVMSKRMLAHMKPTQLQFYTSVAALALQAPFVLRDAEVLLHWRAAEVDEEDSSLQDNRMGLGKLLVIDAIFYHLQSVSAYCTMGCMSPVSQSVANTLKRALLVWASILYFGNPVTGSGVMGIIMVVLGVFLYNHVRRVHHT